MIFVDLVSVVLAGSINKRQVHLHLFLMEFHRINSSRIGSRSCRRDPAIKVVQKNGIWVEDIGQFMINH